MKRGEPQQVLNTSNRERYWLKPASEGANSLMRAASNALYFTEVFYHELQHRALTLFIKMKVKADSEDPNSQIHSISNDSSAIFLKNPGLPEFKELSLYLLSLLSGRRIKLYCQTGDSASKLTFNPSMTDKNSLRIVETAENHFSAAFKRCLLPIFIECQNIIFSSVDSATNSHPFRFATHNDGVFISLELRQWQKKSDLSASRPVKVGFNYRKLLFSSCDTSSLNSSRQSRENVNDQTLMPNSVDSIGDEIMSILKSRRNDQAHMLSAFGAQKRAPRLIKSDNDRPLGFGAGIASLNKTAIIEKFNMLSDESRAKDSNQPSIQQQLDTATSQIDQKKNNLAQAVSFGFLDTLFKNSQITDDSTTQSTQLDVKFVKKSQFEAEGVPNALFNPEFNCLEAKMQLNPHVLSASLPSPSDPIKLRPSGFLAKSSGQNLNLDKELNKIFEDGDLDVQNLSYPTIQTSEFGVSVVPLPPKTVPNVVLEPKFSFSDLNAPAIKPEASKRSSLKERFQHRTVQDFVLKENPQDATKQTLAPVSNTDQKIPVQAVANIVEVAFQSESSLNFQANHLEGNPSSRSALKMSQDSGDDQQPKHFTQTVDEAFYEGTLKFFDYKNGFGFVTVINKEAPYDVFIYRKEFQRAKIKMDIIRLIKEGIVLRLRFQIAHYVGRHNESKKAVNIQLLSVSPLEPSN